MPPHTFHSKNSVPVIIRDAGTTILIYVIVFGNLISVQYSGFHPGVNTPA